MAKKNRRGKKTAAALAGSGILLAAFALNLSFQEESALAAEDSRTKEEISLSIAGRRAKRRFRRKLRRRSGQPCLWRILPPRRRRKKKRKN